MRKRAFILSCLLLMTQLSGCSMAMQPEHQAYIISMGIDRTQDDLITVSVQYPTIGGAQAQDNSEKQNSGYLISSSTSHTFNEALDLLRATLPRNMQLSQMKSIIVSDTIAQDAGFNVLIEELMMTYQLYGASTIIVCLGSAKEFLKAQTPTVGSRLSTGVTAELEHYQHQGYMPVTTLYSLFSATRSIYSTPILTLAATAQGDMRTMARERLGEALPGTLNREGENKNEYMGCALIDHTGRMVGMLNGLLTQWVEILCRDINTVSYMRDGQLVGLKAIGVDTHIDVDAYPLRVYVRLRMVSRPLNEQPPLQALAQSVQTDLEQVVQLCQQVGVEPFGWAEIASGNFATIEDFLAYDFIARFRDAQVIFDVNIEQG